MAVQRCDFALRSGRKALPALGGGDPTYEELFDQQGEVDEWRLVTLQSLTGLPFNARLTWGSGRVSGFHALLTAAPGARVCVFCRALKIEAANLAPAANTVIAAVPDGFAVTSNVYEVRSGQTATEDEVEPPPFARSVRLDLEADTAYATSYLKLKDAGGTGRAHLYANAQPDQGLPVGGAGSVSVWATSSYRLVFHLHL